MPKKKSKKLTFKETEFVKHFVASKGLQGQSIVKAGYNIGARGGKEKNFRAIASEMGRKKLEKPEIQKSIEQIMNDNNISREKIIKVMSELLYSDDKRVQLGVLDQLHKILGSYSPDKKILLARSEIFQEIKELPEEADPNLKDKLPESVVPEMLEEEE